MAMSSTAVTRAALFSAVCIALNVSLNKLAVLLQLPVFMDTVGTVLSGALVPPPFSIAVGVISNLIGGVITHPAIPFFSGTQVVVSLMSIFGFHRGWFDRAWSAALWGLAIGIVSAIVSAPVTVLMFGGVTEPGATAINAMLIAAGKNIWTAVLTGTIIVSSIDKIIAALVTMLVLKRMPDRLKQT